MQVSGLSLQRNRLVGMSLRVCQFIRACTILVLCTTVLYAHPHIFVDVKAELLFGKEGFVGIRHHWLFDEMYSTAMLAGIDTDKNGKLDPAEVRKVWSEIVQPMQRFGYFNHLANSKEVLKSPADAQFVARIDKGRIACDFVLPYSVGAGGDYSMLLLVLADPVNYTSLTVDFDGTKIESPSGIEVDWFIDTVDGMTLFNGMPKGTEGIFFRFRKVK